MLSSLASPQVPLWPIPLSLTLFGLFILIESKWTTEPVIPVRLLRSRPVLLTCTAALGMMMARWAVLFFTPVYAIAVRGWSPASAGLILVPTNAGFGTGGLLVGWLHIRKASSYYM
jgi:sugar phosphate permease